MTYVKQTWSNGIAGGTPISAARLNHIEDGIEAAGTASGIVTSSSYVSPDTGLDVTTQMQAFLTAWALSKGVAILAPGNYIVSGALLFNHLPSAARPQFHLLAYGARITSSYNGVVIGDALPLDTSAASALLQRRLSVHGLTIVGNGGNAQTGIRTVCRAWLHLNDVQVEGCHTNYDAIFCLQGRISGCNSSVATTYGYRARSGAGLWTGGTGPNSASNHLIFCEGTRDYATTGMLSQFYIEDSQGVVLRDCVTEGGNPVNAIHYTTIVHDVVYGHSGGRTFKVDNHHGENFPTNAHVRADAFSGHVILEEFESQTGGVIIDGSLSSITTVISGRLPTIVSSPAFKTAVGGPRFAFEIPSNYGATSMRASSLWVGGTVGSTGSLRFNDATAESSISGIGLGLAGQAPFMHGDDIHFISDRTTFNVPGIHMNGATEIGVYDNGPVAGAFLANSRICPSLDTGANVFFTAKQSNGVIRFASIPQVVQNLLGWIFTRKTAAPADADLAASEMTLWFDSTAGAAKLMIKAKNASGTVVTGSVNLT